MILQVFFVFVFVITIFYFKDNVNTVVFLYTNVLKSTKVSIQTLALSTSPPHFWISKI